MSKLTKAAALAILALWGLAVVHCRLEVVPGLGFLQTCCSTDSEASAPSDCEGDGCGAVEDGGYRAAERTVAAPHPAPMRALLMAAVEPRPAELGACASVLSRFPPELPRLWQFSCRTALPPRAPSIVA